MGDTPYRDGVWRIHFEKTQFYIGFLTAGLLWAFTFRCADPSNGEPEEPSAVISYSGDLQIGSLVSFDGSDSMGHEYFSWSYMQASQ
jgi:hypothetical protein